MNIFLLFILLQNISSLRIIFYPSKRIVTNFYEPFIERLEKVVNQPIEIYDAKNNIIIDEIGLFAVDLIDTEYQKCIKDENNIIITHSHHECVNKDNNTLAIISINGINYEENIPSLTILSSNDEKMPLYYALNDVSNTCENNITNKYYQVNNGSHTSMFENSKNINLLTNQINYFINDLLQTNLTKSTNIRNAVFNKHSWFFQHRLLTNTKIFNNFFKFFFTEPEKENTLFSSNRYVLYKSKDVNITKELDDYYFLNMKYNITNLSNRYRKDFFSIGDTISNIIKYYTRFNVFLVFYYFCEFYIKVFLNEYFFKIQLPFIIYQWYKCEPKLNNTNSSIVCDVFSVSMQDNIVYYKFPSKNKIFEFILKQGK